MVTKWWRAITSAVTFMRRLAYVQLGMQLVFGFMSYGATRWGSTNVGWAGSTLASLQTRHTTDGR